MGEERWYVAVVDGCRLLERARNQPTFGEHLAVIGNFQPGRRVRVRDEPHAAFLAEVDAMNREHPGIDGRIYSLDRWFDVLHYLISATRRGGAFDAVDLGARTILGAARMPGHLLGGQGHPIRYSPPAAVRESALFLGGLSAADLHLAYNPEAMEARAVYKFWAERAQEPETWPRIVDHLEGLRSVYTDAASQGEGILAIVT